MGREKAFTLIELVIVLIITVVLASIAAPMMMNMKTREVCKEAVSAMGTIRASLRMYCADNNSYPVTNGVWLIDMDPHALPELDIVNDLKGLYFGPECYNYISDGTWVRLRAYFDPNGNIIFPAGQGHVNSAPKGAEIINIPDSQGGFIEVDEKGDVGQYQASKSGYPARY